MSELDHDFDKNYRDKMRQQTDLDFSEADWPKLAGRLDEADRRRHRSFPIWWLGAIGGLLLLSNLGWFFTFRGMKSEVSSVENELRARRDTVFLTTTERRVDTVFIKAIERLAAPAPVFFEKKGGLESASGQVLLAELKRRFPESLAALLAESGFEKSSTFQKTVGDDGDSVSKKDGLGFFQKTKTGLPKIGQRLIFPLISTKKAEAPIPEQEFEAEPVILDYEKRPVRFFENDWWMTGISTGFTAPVSADMTRKNGQFFGASLEYGYSANRSIWLEASETRINCAGNSTHDYALPVPYWPGYRIANFETTDGPKTALRLGLGGRWRASEGKKWGRLGIGLGYVLEFEKKYFLNLDYRSDQDNSILSEKWVVEKSKSPVGYYHADAGIEWRLGAGWVGSVNVWKEAKGHFNHGLPGYFGAKAGVGYKF